MKKKLKTYVCSQTFCPDGLSSDFTDTNSTAIHPKYNPICISWFLQIYKLTMLAKSLQLHFEVLGKKGTSSIQCRKYIQNKLNSRLKVLYSNYC